MKQSLVLVLVSLLAISSLPNCDAFPRLKRCAQTTEEKTTVAPDFCNQTTVYCKDYNGITVFVDFTSRVSYYADGPHCESLGAKMYIPETEADNIMMFNVIQELSPTDFSGPLSYPLIPENGSLIWEDGKRTPFDSGIYWESPDINQLVCYFVNSDSPSLTLTPEQNLDGYGGCTKDTKLHLCAFS